MLELEDLETFYGESQILWGVSMKVDDGQSVALLGRNGMGKTTAVRSIMGLTPPRQGRIVFSGVETTRVETPEDEPLGAGPRPSGEAHFSLVERQGESRLRDEGRRLYRGEYLLVLPRPQS